MLSQPKEQSRQAHCPHSRASKWHPAPEPSWRAAQRRASHACLPPLIATLAGAGHPGPHGQDGARQHWCASWCRRAASSAVHCTGAAAVQPPASPVQLPQLQLATSPPSNRASFPLALGCPSLSHRRGLCRPDRRGAPAARGERRCAPAAHQPWCARRRHARARMGPLRILLEPPALAQPLQHSACCPPPSPCGAEQVHVMQEAGFEGAAAWWQRPPEAWRPGERLLACAAAAVADLRAAVAAELGYTCSAGVAHTKLMAKLCSG